MRKKQMSFTLIEIILIISILMIITGVSFPFLSRNLTDYYFYQTISTIKNFIYKAQTYSMNEKNGEIWGVCIFNNEVKIFKQNCTNGNFLDSYKIPTNIQIVNFQTVNFSKIRGEINQSITFTIISPNNSKTLTINKVGIID